MKLIKAIQKWANKRSYGVRGNRKKVGILLFQVSILVFIVLVIRFSWISMVGVVQGVNLEKQTTALYQGEQITKAKRGTIYDRYGQVIAEDATSYSVYAILSKTYTGANDEKLYAEEQNFDKLADILYDKLGIKKEDSLKRLRVNVGEKDPTKLAYQVEFGNDGKGINLSKKNAIEKAMDDAGVKGLYFLEHPDRIYPNGEFASLFIGKAESQDDDESSTKGLVGTMGLEKAYNSILSGQDGIMVYKKDLQGNPMPGTIRNKQNEINGEDIYTTIDSRLQTYLETLMDKVNKTYKPELLTATLMDAKTGELLAMSQRPSFNPDSGKAPSVWRNVLVQDMYEPGSTMKVFTTAASVNTGQFQPNATYEAGEIKVYDTTIHDHDWTKNGAHALNYKQALWWSSNVGMVHLEQKLGDLWPVYQRKFLFGESTNSGLPSETEGTLPLPSNPVDLAMSSFGQGVNVTNFQMMRAFSSVSNNGVMLQPHYISKVVDPNKNTQKIAEPEVLGKPITADTAKYVRDLMVGVAQDSQWGSAHTVNGPIYKVPGITISPKTGTAQIASDTGGYYQSKYLNSVVVMAPTENPKFVLYVTMKLDGPMPFDALATLTNPFLKRAMESEDQPIDVGNGGMTEFKMENYEGKNVNEASVLARRLLLNPVIIGDGDTVKKQSIPIGEKVSANTKILILSDGSMTMPDVTTWTEAELKQFETITGVKLKIEGKGKASSQSVPFNARIKKNQEITVKLG
jgi:penicillin-binding protein 2X